MSSEDSRILREWLDQKQLRSRLPGSVIVVASPQPIEQLPLFQPSSLLIVWSNDHQILRQAAEALNSGTVPSELLSVEVSGMSASSIGDDTFAAVPAFASVYYGGHELVDPAILPPSKGAIGSVIIPWAGTPLDKEYFSTQSWVLPSADPIAVLVVCNPPQVDEDESLLLAQLPVREAELGIGPAAAPVVVATFVATVLAERYVNKAADRAEREAARRYAQWADKHQKQQDAADRRAAAQNLANRTRWRNGLLAPDPLRSPEDLELPQDMTIEDLLARRIRMLQQPKSPNSGDDGNSRD
jgi:hypothetical protein